MGVHGQLGLSCCVLARCDDEPPDPPADRSGGEVGRATGDQHSLDRHGPPPETFWCRDRGVCSARAAGAGRRRIYLFVRHLVSECERRSCASVRVSTPRTRPTRVASARSALGIRASMQPAPHRARGDGARARERSRSALRAAAPADQNGSFTSPGFAAGAAFSWSRMTNWTRRFFALFASVTFGASGLSCP